MRPPAWVAVLVAVLVTASSSPVLPAAAAAPEAAPSPAPAPGLAGRIDAAMADAAARLAGDPAVALAAVRSGITMEAYPGALKGARGAYLTGSANDVDQAQLLAALLRAADPDLEQRFASCDVPTVGSVGPPGPTRRAIDEAEDLALDLLDLELAAAMLDVADLRERLRSEVDAGAVELAAALEQMGAWVDPTPHPTADTVPHVWLQVAAGGTWLDLDPSSETGAPPCAPAETFDELPAGLSHRLRISLEAEHLRNRALVTSEVLGFERPVADLAESDILFAFGEPAGLVSRPADPGMPGVPYTPVLRVDGETVMGQPLVLPRLRGELGEAAREVLGEAEEVIKDVGGPGPTLTPEGDPVTGAWLVVELIPPAGEPVVLRAEILDRIGAAARHEAHAGGDRAWQPAPLDEVGGEYAALASLWQVGLLLGEIRAPEALADPPPDTSTVDGLSAGLASLLRTYPSMQHDLGGRFVPPGVLLAGLVPVAGAGGEPAARLVLDALHIPSATPVDAPGAARDGWATLMAEAMLTAVVGEGPPGPHAATGVLGAARTVGTGLVAIAPAGPVAIEGASEQALARIAARLEAGYRLVAPAVSPNLEGLRSTAWWVVDPVSGTVRDEHESGRHQPAPEYVGNLPRTLTAAERFRRLTCTIIRPVAFAAQLLYLATGASGAGPAGSASPLHAPLKAVVKEMEREADRRARREAAQRAACAGVRAAGGPGT